MSYVAPCLIDVEHFFGYGFHCVDLDEMKLVVAVGLVPGKIDAVVDLSFVVGLDFVVVVVSFVVGLEVVAHSIFAADLVPLY